LFECHHWHWKRKNDEEKLSETERKGEDRKKVKNCRERWKKLEF
jgi:hypothetical protein